MTLKFSELIAPASSEVDIDFLVIAQLLNEGTEPVNGISGELVLTDGLKPLEATATKREIESIPGGVSRRMAWAVLPTASGKCTVKVVLSCEDGSTEEKSLEIEIKKPEGK